MNRITVSNILPNFISDFGAPKSEIWRKDVSFDKGGKYLISAASGAGKSSLLSYVFGERNDYEGSVSFDGAGFDSLSEKNWNEIRKSQISFVFQGLRLFSNLTAAENVRIKNNLTGHKSDDEIDDMFEITGLSDKKNEKAARLSFGQQQRVAVIRALCQPFDFLFMDEPFSHLDDDNIRIVVSMVNKEIENRDAGLILCSLGLEYFFEYTRKFAL